VEWTSDKKVNNHNLDDSLMAVLLYSLVSVALVSVVSLVGVLTFSLNEKAFKNSLLYLVSFSAGGLFGDAFIHLIPEAAEANSFGVHVSLLILFGIIVSFSVETFLKWRHCHIPTSQEHPHSFVYMNLLGDAVHNFLDGLLIGGSYLSSTALGIATTVAVIFHEIPQEIGDFGVLIYGGLKKSRALFFNFVTALTAVIGVIAAFILSSVVQGFIPLLIPFAAGNFIYIAGTDLIPELHKGELEPFKAALHLVFFVLGILMLFLLVFLE
jgi:zinc and cadmium transporter